MNSICLIYSFFVYNSAIFQLFENIQRRAINNKKEMNDNNQVNAKGNIIFFTDGPDNRTNPGENAYISLLNSARKYAYIYTPYFIVSPELLGAITNAASGGVDVRLVTPHIPDKWYVHMVTRRYYDILLKSGVKVYEYLPGFLHAKALVADSNTDLYCYCIMILNYMFDKKIGSINIDDFYKCLNYLETIGVSKKLVAIFSRIVAGCQNENPVDYIETITEKQLIKARLLKL